MTVEEKPGSLLISILFENAALYAVDKPAGLPSEPTRDPQRPNVLSVLRQQLGLDSAAFLGLPHRLDRDTSGVLLIARLPQALATLNQFWKERRVRKIYVALVHGRVEKNSDRIESFLGPKGRRGGIEFHGGVSSGGKKAITTYRVIERRGATTLVECVLETGRTHQARAHLAELGHPLLGDELYGAPSGEHARLHRHLLHALRIEIPDPQNPQTILTITSPLPPEFSLPIP